MSKFIISFFISIIFFSGCNNDTITDPAKDAIVIRAYLYANEPVYDIQITGTTEIGSDSITPPPVNNATVYLVKDGLKYFLEPSAGDSGYYHYSGTNLVIKTGDIFDIYAEYNGKTAYGQTEVPPPPENLTMSPDTLYISSSEETPVFRFDTTRLKVQWDSVANATYFILIESVESNPESISTGMGAFPGMGRLSRFLSQPTDQNIYTINRMNLSYYGKHKIKVYRINQEYADLYRSRQQDSRNLNEPLTNIKDGLGIFSAFNSIEGYFYVIKN